MTRPAVHLPERLRSEIIDHCRSELPNEGCGLIALAGDQIVRVYPTDNKDRSPSGFTIPPEQHYAALTDAESNGWALGGVFHSHPHGTAKPSMVDVQTALDPDWVYLVVGLRGGTDMRAWSIREGEIDEVDLLVDP
ncbi:MAG: M67 family metallopeptidase [Acidimicrobiia bacterium]|nr:M67 family metallopeptidase [Acidimicrobiia bacterium]